MNKLLKYNSMIIISVLLMSCATTVKFQIEHPPLVDMRNVNTITVIPLEWNNNEPYGYLANDLTKSLTAGIKRQKNYNFIDPNILKNMGALYYSEYVDVYILCRIIDVKSYDESEKKEETDGEKTKTKKYVTRTVTVSIEYKYIRAINNEVLGTFNKDAVSSVTFDDSDRSSKWWGELLLDIFLPKGKPVEKIAKSAVQKFSNDMNKELLI
ncbi:hypothetical protein AGMMS50268_12080 [Spirochaetia bacterium]|nr:hypothetical protein AGMMS50268_12080 [Spirochaetia bacterium]